MLLNIPAFVETVQQLAQTWCWEGEGLDPEAVAVEEAVVGTGAADVADAAVAAAVVAAAASGTAADSAPGGHPGRYSGPG